MREKLKDYIFLNKEILHKNDFKKIFKRTTYHEFMKSIFENKTLTTFYPYAKYLRYPKSKILTIKCNKIIKVKEIY